MTDVFLVYPPYKLQLKNPPLGLGYIAAVLEQGGFSVEILDMNITGADPSVMEERIRALKPRIVGFSFMTPQIRTVDALARRVKAIDPHALVVAGGPHCSAIPEEVLENSDIDIAVLGEGEHTLHEIATSLLRGGAPLHEIAGIALRLDGAIRRTPPRAAIMELDALPFPAWHLLPVERYSMVGHGGTITKPTLAILSSRGCPNHCVFCDSHSVFGRRFRGRSARNIFAEVKMLHERYGTDQFDFVDDTISIDRKRLSDLCLLILGEPVDGGPAEPGLKITWMANARVNTVTPELLLLMHRAGCVRVDFGVETGDPEILKLLKKGITLDQIRQAHQWAKDAGITTASFLIVGSPGETWKSVEMTAEFVRSIASDFPSVSVATPFPGSELHEIARERGWILESDWSRYTPTPYQDPDYRPIMRTDTMSAQEIIEAYYYLNRVFARKKFHAKYGSYFLLRPGFWRKTIMAVRSPADLRRLAGVARKLAMGGVAGKLRKVLGRG